MKRVRTIALVAHDNKKDDLLRWAEKHQTLLSQQKLYATGTTGRLLQKQLGFPMICLQSGPLGGDLQIGAMIAEGQIDLLIFFWDPLEAQPHDPDIKALLRVAVVWDILVATNPQSAEFIITSPRFTEDYPLPRPDFADHHQRPLP